MKNAIPLCAIPKLPQLLFLLFAVLLAAPPKGNAQPVGQRVDLHSLSPAEQQTLANHIKDWLLANHHIVEDHTGQDCFDEIHTTDNFMPWHRVHVRMLESYIALQTNNPGYRLPKWDPGVTPPGGGPKIPVPFQVTASGISIHTGGTMNFSPGPDVPTPGAFTQEFIDMQDFLNKLLPGNCGTNPNPGGFSDQMEANYHNHGHTVIDGIMNENNAPDCLIFWPWHAWVDDLWYVWERDCGTGGNPVQAYHRPLIQGATEYIVNGSETWSNTMFIKGIVRIPNGAELNVAANATIHFRESQYNAFPTRIVVEPGGTLFVQSGATLTGIDEFGNGIEGGAKYFTGWDGIIVQGNPLSPSPLQQGQVLLAPNSRIEHTVNGIRSENGGIIDANQANFYNNRRDVFIGPYAFDHASNFTGCSFINDQPLRDVEWHASGTVCSETEHYFAPYGHLSRSRSSENHIVLSGVNDISFQNCTIDNPFKDGKIFYLSRGISMSNSRCVVQQCSIRNQINGIFASNKVPGPGNHVTVRTSTFDKNDQGIVLHGADFSVIENNNTFIIPHKGIAGLPFLGIYSDGSAGLVIDDNNYSSATSTFTPPDYNRGAVIINTTGNAASFERRDNFSGVSVASQAQGDNSNLQIRCNTYNGFDHAIAVTSGTLTHQGECDDAVSPANNTWDNLGTCISDESQIYRAPGATPFSYRAHSSQLPTCYTIGVTVDNCLTGSTPASCANGEAPPCSGCELQRIVDLETAKDALPPGDGHIQFIAHEQQLIYQQGVNERLEEGNTGLDDAIEFTEDVEAVTALYPGNKAALLLLKSEQGTVASGTSAAIAAVPATDPNKKWLDLRYDLLTSGRTYSQLTATEKAMVEAEAQQHTKSGAHAKAILEEAYGIPVTLYVDLIDSERSSKPVVVTKATSSWSIAPNPAKELTYISFTAPEVGHQSWLTVSDLNGHLYRQIDLGATFGETQIPLSIADLPVGIYLLRLQLEGQPAEVKKLTIIR